MFDKTTVTSIVEIMDARISQLRDQERVHSQTNSKRMMRLPHRGNEFYTHGQMEDMLRESRLTLEAIRKDLVEAQTVDLTQARALMESTQELGQYLEKTYPKDWESMYQKHTPQAIAMAMLERKEDDKQYEVVEVTGTEEGVGG